MKITIIGGSGFVGTRLTKRLINAGYIVRIADKRMSHTYPELWMRCDIRNLFDEKNDFPESLTDAVTAPGKAEEAAKSQPMHSLLEALQGSDAVINLAAEHRDDVTPKSLYDDVNVKGSENICKACTELGVRHILFTSSVAVYGFAPAGTDENGKIHYFNDYGRTKYLAERKYCDWLSKDNTNCATIIRPTVIFGEQNRGNVYNLLRQIAGGKFMMIGKGNNRKSMNYVENVVAFIQFCIENADKFSCFDTNYDGTSSGKLHLFNYCDTPVYDMNALVRDVYKCLGKTNTHIFRCPYFIGYFGGLCFDLLAKILHKKFAISAIRVKKFCQTTYFSSVKVPETGFHAPVPLQEGLRRTIDYEFIKKTQGHVFVCE